VGVKLYYGGFGQYKAFAVAEDMDGAVRNIGLKLNAPFLPITAEEISEVDGYVIQPVFPCEKPDDITTFDEKTEEADKGVTLRHCKKCDFTCENQSEMMRHYRDFHPKGD